MRRAAVTVAGLMIVWALTVRTAHANNSVAFGNGPMKNLYVDLVFWGPNCAPGAPTTWCFVQDPDPHVDDRQIVMSYVTNFASWLRGGYGPDGTPPPVGLEPAIHSYGITDIYPGWWLNDWGDPIPSADLQGQGTSSLGDTTFRPIVAAAQNGGLGAAYDFQGNVASFSGLPMTGNHLTLVITKGTNSYCVGEHQLLHCESALGFHDTTTSGTPFGAVMIEQINPVLSHEIMEAMSDPILLPGIVLGGENQTGWYSPEGEFSQHELADECENESGGKNYSLITVDPMYAEDGVSTGFWTCRQTIPEQHAPLAATLEYGVMGQQPLSVFYVDTNGHVQVLTWDYAGQSLSSGPYDYGQPSPTVKAVGKPSAVYTFSGGGEYVFVKGSDGDVWMRNNNVWTPFGGRIYGNPSVVVWNWNNATWVHVAVLGTDDRVYTQGVLNGVPQGWGQMPSGSVMFAGAPTIVSRGANSLDVFAAGEDGQMKLTEYTQAGGWTPTVRVDQVSGSTDTSYVMTPFVSTPAVAVLSPTSLQVIGSEAATTEVDTGMFVARWNGSAQTSPTVPNSSWWSWDPDNVNGTSNSWQTWITPFLDAMPKSLSMPSLQGTPAIVSSGNGRVDAFAVDRTGNLWWFYSTNETTWYSVTTNGGSIVTNPHGVPNSTPANAVPLVSGGVTGDPVAIARAVNQVEVFYRTQTGSLTHMTFNESANTWSTESVLSVLGSGIIYDPAQVGGSATQCFAGGSWMHCCPTGYAMVGADVGNNRFKCAPFSQPAGSVTGDGGTSRNNMHSCPYGQVMVGLRADRNILACVALPANAVVNERVDPGTQDVVQSSIHACDPGTPTAAMSGIDVGNNLVNCATTAQIQ
jgi:hypothetical protein